MSSLLRLSIPLLSTTMIFFGSAPALMSMRTMQTFAAPMPIMVIFASSIFFPTILRAFTRPASVTAAVPCWSSCQTGIGDSALNLSRT
jgi:hypothetical protein